MLFARNFHFKERNASGKCVLRYLVPKHIACSDVISSNWRMALWGYKPRQLKGYGIFWPKINGIRDTQTPPNGASPLQNEAIQSRNISHKLIPILHNHYISCKRRFLTTSL